VLIGAGKEDNHDPNEFCRSLRKPDWPAQHPSLVIAVDDIQAAMRKVAEAGGKVLGEPMEIPGIGQYVSFVDTEDNRVSMLQPIPRD
jgi:uncharacterized protein